jgi:hypothetical protein
MTALLMFIRHAEKPVGIATGITEDGVADPESLTVRGWQRAGALATYFRDALPPLQVPARIYASDVIKKDGSGSRSKRPLQTISPLAALVGLTPDRSFTKGQEVALAATLNTATVPVFISWQHESIAAIVDALGGPPSGAPAVWPDDVYDWVWILTKNGGDGWHFSETRQQLLAGDTALRPSGVV